MAIQELDLPIHYRPGSKNQNEEALSRDPVAALFLSTTVPDVGKPTVQLATVQGEEQSTKGGDDSLEERDSGKILKFFKSSCTWRAVSYQQMRKEHRR